MCYMQTHTPTIISICFPGSLSWFVRENWLRHDTLIIVPFDELQVVKTFENPIWFRIPNFEPLFRLWSKWIIAYAGASQLLMYVIDSHHWYDGFHLLWCPLFDLSCPWLYVYRLVSLVIRLYFSQPRMAFSRTICIMTNFVILLRQGFQ